MNKLYVVKAYNGETYEDYDVRPIMAFSTAKAAWQLKREMNARLNNARRVRDAFRAEFREVKKMIASVIGPCPRPNRSPWRDDPRREWLNRLESLAWRKMPKSFHGPSLCGYASDEFPEIDFFHFSDEGEFQGGIPTPRAVFFITTLPFGG